MANANEYGLMDLIDRDILNPNENVTTADSDLLLSGILVDNARHNADIRAVLNMFTTTTDLTQEGIEQAGGARNQPLDEKGRAVPMKPAAPYNVAYPLISSGNAWGATWAARQKMKVKDLARVMSRIYIGDYNWVFDHVLAALFTNASYTSTDPITRTALTIQGLANGDSVNYFRTTDGTASADTHYLATASAIADAANPFPTIKDELLEHPDNAGEVIAFIPSGLVSTTTALAEFNSATIDPDILLGANTDRLDGSLDVSLPPYTTVKGKTDSGVWVVEMPRLPAGYIVAVTTQGERPLARRVDNDFGDGFLVRSEREDYPLYETQLSRWEGYGARNRAGALVYRIGNGSYAIPTNYTSPMP